MAFMEPQVWKSTFVKVDGPAGTEWVEAEFLDLKEVDRLGKKLEHGRSNRISLKGTGLEEFFENSEAWEIEITDGWGAMMSAPGYMDRTDLCVFDTEEEAEEYLKENYGEEEEGIEDNPSSSSRCAKCGDPVSPGKDLGGLCERCFNIYSREENAKERRQRGYHGEGSELTWQFVRVSNAMDRVRKARKNLKAIKERTGGVGQEFAEAELEEENARHLFIHENSVFDEMNGTKTDPYDYMDNPCGTHRNMPPVFSAAVLGRVKK